ncbi:hypothetical protein B5C34_08540 [Pacificimonas flava]|uniref:TonB-dependent receptor n=2 Tax=Pacificimonas TaxID=1960290 RepID=A0A219B5E4_9SPHN|nr:MULTISPECIES: TonB-dependent receptor [Pacificimonas]MBZ6379289.1 TonB-dependent receptor [Pacificimonas aurantium]OWV33501.1 hypothetical protein B5C34_08540 [Pacificimonas flava]
MRSLNRAAPALIVAVAVAVAAIATSTAAAAQGTAVPDSEGPPQIEAEWEPGSEIVIYGRAEAQIGTAIAASEGAVAGAALGIRPLLRPGELLEVVPGLIATQHSGGGKANQYFLRGFNLDHGTDFAVYIDDFPVNFRTHGHGQGYLDVNGLIPETVRWIDYRKGPYRADAGDFSLAGASLIKTYDRMRPFALIEAGNFDYLRAALGGSAAIGGADLLLAGQAKFNDGPWDLPEDFEAYSGFAKLSAELGSGTLSASLSIYKADWRPTEQLPERAVGTVAEDRFASLDRTLTGRTDREVLTLGYRSDAWRVTAWAQHYDWELFSNFTYFLEDPVNGDQFRQYDDLTAYGGRAERSFRPLEDDRLTLRIGAELREDDIGTVGLDETIRTEVERSIGAFAVKESSAGLYAEAVWRPAPRVLLSGGLRNDWYRFRTSALRGEESWDGVERDDSFAAKFGASYEVAEGVALYANYGEGFHSNDARGVTRPDDPSPGLVEGDFEEVGLRVERGDAILSAVYWWGSVESELVFLGDEGVTEPTAPSKREGYELTAFWTPADWLAVDAVLTETRARSVGVPIGENRIPGALELAAELGVSLFLPEFNAAARVRHFGAHPLTEANDVRTEGTTLVNMRAGWTPHVLEGVEFYAELLNLFDSEESDIAYYYETRLPGEPNGVEGVNSRIVEPRQLRVGVRKAF